MALWNRREESEEGGAAAEAKFNENLTKTIKETVEASNAGNKSTIDSLAATMKAINERFAAEEVARNKAAKEEKKVTRTQEEEQEFMLNDPDGYTRSKIEPTTRLALITNGKLVRNETLSGKPYYFGSFKQKVDELIDNSSSNNLQLRSDPSFVNNCYKIVMADHMEEIQAGKLKQTAALQSFSDGQRD